MGKSIDQIREQELSEPGTEPVEIPMQEGTRPDTAEPGVQAEDDTSGLPPAVHNVPYEEALWENAADKLLAESDLEAFEWGHDDDDNAQLLIETADGTALRITATPDLSDETGRPVGRLALNVETVEPEPSETHDADNDSEAEGDGS